MRVLWSWLKELVELEQAPEEAAELLNIAGIEVDEIERSGPQFSGVITARIEDVSPHPNADKLSVCRVFDGTEERTVVCGATNMKAGDGVALAVHKARLPGGVVKRGKIRGERSEGMLCSEVELEIGDDGDGIMILPGYQQLGVPVQQVLGLDDCVLVLDLTPDRADCLGMVGVARELAALTGAELKGAAKLGAWWEEVAPGPSSTLAGAGEMSVPITIEDADGCPRYTGPGGARRRDRAVTCVDGPAPQGRWRGCAQQRGGRHQLPVPVARPAVPRVRPEVLAGPASHRSARPRR